MARDIATSMTPSRRLGPRGGDRVRSTAHGLSKVDAALLGAALGGSVALVEALARGAGYSAARPAAASAVSDAMISTPVLAPASASPRTALSLASKAVFSARAYQ